MSLDYPYCAALRRRHHPAAKWWRLGDTLYYIGILSAFVRTPAIGLAKWKAGWIVLPYCLAVLGAGIAVNRLGLWLKDVSYRQGERDSISAAEVYANPTGRD